MGSAMTYARRYLKMGLLDIAAVGEDDDGRGASKAQELKNQQTAIMKFLKDKDNEFLKALEEEEETDGEVNISDNGEEPQKNSTTTQKERDKNE